VSVSERLIESRRERLQLRLADLKEYDSKWSWSFKPSQRRYVEKRITRAEKRLASFEAKYPESTPTPTHGNGVRDEAE
jgi:hypothetical protein